MTQLFPVEIKFIQVQQHINNENNIFNHTELLTHSVFLFNIADLKMFRSKTQIISSNMAGYR